MSGGLFILITLSTFLLGVAIVFGFYYFRSQQIIKLNKKGLQFKDWEMWDDAIRCFQRAIELDKNHALSYYNLGFVLYYGKKLIDAAIEAFETSLTKNDAFARTYYSLGHAQFHGKGDLENARANLTNAIHIDPDLAQAHTTMGLVEIKMENWKKAIEHFKTALSIDDSLESAYCNLAIALVYQGRNTEAREVSKKYVSLKPESAQARNNMGNIYGSCGMKEEAVKELLVSRSIDSNDWNVHFWLGCLWLQLGNYTKATSSFHHAIQLHGEFGLAHYNLALCYEGNNQKTHAKKHIERALELDPTLGENLI